MRSVQCKIHVLPPRAPDAGPVARPGRPRDTHCHRQLSGSALALHFGEFSSTTPRRRRFRELILGCLIDKAHDGWAWALDCERLLSVVSMTANVGVLRP